MKKAKKRSWEGNEEDKIEEREEKEENEKEKEEKRKPSGCSKNR